MRKILTYLLFLVVAAPLAAQTVSLTETGGWMESAFVKWQPVEGADKYNVYVSGNGLVDQLIDTQLVRSYGSYFRADVLGLAPGAYTVKVAAVISNVEGPRTESGSITVWAHDRNGFAFQGGHIPGAYNLNGTLKTNAVVIYITQNTKNTISMVVAGANSNPCVGLQAILDGFKKGVDNRPLAVRLIGNITDPSYLLGGDIVIENKNNPNGGITFEGVGNDAYANGWGVRVKKGTNIEIRNLGFMLTNASEGDNVGLQQDNDHVWVHNCDMFYGDAGGDADQAKGDGALDCKRSTYVTFSYNHFWDSGKSNLLGLSESGPGLYATYHHNWYDHSDSRHPRVRTYSAHVYNNYFDGNAKYGAGSTMASSLFIEGNFFRNCKYPMLISQQGTDVFNGAQGTFSGEEGGMIKAYNNEMSGQQRFIAYDPVDWPVQFDAYVVSARNQTVPNSITSADGGNSYNNFDTDPSLYVNSLVVDEPAVARDKVMQFSGRVGGGDLIWTFNNAVDDTSYAVNAGLAAALNNYTTALVYVQGETVVVISSQTLAIPANNDQTVPADVSITPMVFTWGGTATDATVIGLPASGIDFVKDMAAKTITVTGAPTDDVSFSVTTIGSSGTPVSGAGSITIGELPAGDLIHNFTASGLVSTYYSFASANMNSTAGNTTYDGLTLTARLKIESATVITYTAALPSTLTLVFDPTFNGTIKLNTVPYTAVNGVAIIPNVPAGLNTITKGTTTNLYYIKTVYNTLGTTQNTRTQQLTLYPNPVTDVLHIDAINVGSIRKVAVYNLVGQLVKAASGNVQALDLSDLSAGSYFVKIDTDQGVMDRKIIKK